MADNLDAFGNMVRSIRNLYNGVFETAKVQKRNEPYRNSVTSRGGILMADTLTELYEVTGLVARAYQDITSEGTPYDDEDGIVAGNELLLPDNSVLTPSQGWIFARVRPSYAYNTSPNSYNMIVDWSASANERITMLYNATNQKWSLWHTTDAGATTNHVEQTYNHAADELIEILVAWKTNGNASLWMQGLSVVTNGIPSGKIPAVSAAEIYLGVDRVTMANELEGLVDLMVMGIGEVTDDDAELFYAMPATPTIYEIPNNGTTLPSFLWLGNSLDHEPFGVAGEALAGA